MSKREPDAFIVTTDDGWDVVNSDILDRYVIKSAEEDDGQGGGVSKQIKDDGWDYNDLHEPLYNPEQLTDLLERNTYHAQACSVVARESGGLGFSIKPVSEEENPDDEHKRVLIKFFKSFKINDVLYRRQYDRGSIGYGAIEIIREGGNKSELLRLDHIPSYTLRRHKDGKRVKQQIGNKTVWFILYGTNKDRNGEILFDVDSETGEIHPPNSLPVKQLANEILWSLDYTPTSHYYGMPRVISAIGAIYGDISCRDYNNSFFTNYGMPAFAVTVTGDFETYDKVPGDEGYDETKTLRYKMSQQLKEVIKNPHSAVTILIPSEGEDGNVEAKIQPLSVETKEASFRLYRKDNRDEVLAAHRVPAYRLGINETGRLGGSNSAESSKIYKTSVLEPLQSDDEYDMNWLIREEFGFTDWEFQLEDIDINDFAGDVIIAEKMFNMASMTPRDNIRYFGERFGVKDDPNNPFLDEYYLNGQPLEKVWNPTPDVDPPGTNTVLSDLEDSIIEDMEVSSANPENTVSAVKAAFKRLKAGL
jgi:PBSX family phage portal protein